MRFPGRTFFCGCPFPAGIIRQGPGDDKREGFSLTAVGPGCICIDTYINIYMTWGNPGGNRPERDPQLSYRHRCDRRAGCPFPLPERFVAGQVCRTGTVPNPPAFLQRNYPDFMLVIKCFVRTRGGSFVHFPSRSDAAIRGAAFFLDRGSRRGLSLV